MGPTHFDATLTEPAIAGDSTSGKQQGGLPAWFAYGGEGDVTAPLVYVNYGMPADYEALKRLGVDVRGKIVIARYGGGWRGLKPKLAQEHGAVGCIVYSDPADDGYGQGAAWPEGPYRPERGFQRGSIQDLPVQPGDPLTPGYGVGRGRQAHPAGRSPPAEDPGRADLLGRRSGLPQGPGRTGRAQELPRRARLHLSRGRRRPGQGPPGGLRQLEPGAALRRDRQASRAPASPTSG